MEELNKALNKIFAPVSDATELPDDAGRSSPHAPSRCTRTEPMHTHTHRYSRVRMRRHTRCANMSIQCTGRHAHSVRAGDGQLLVLKKLARESERNFEFEAAHRHLSQRVGPRAHAHASVRAHARACAHTHTHESVRAHARACTRARSIVLSALRSSGIGNTSPLQRPFDRPFGSVAKQITHDQGVRLPLCAYFEPSITRRVHEWLSLA